MSRRNRSTASPTSPPVDLRAVARAFLADAGGVPLAIRPEALETIVAIARADDPVMTAPAAFISDRNGGARNVNGAGVAIVPLQGVITPRGSWLDVLFGGGSGGLQGFRRRFRDAIKDDDVTAVVLDVHSPGGTIGLVPETAAELRAARGAKPVVAVANTMAGSAAYWIAAQADEVVATPSGFVGSIGVYIVHTDWSAFNAELGILPTYISAGKYKTEGNPDEPLGGEARNALQVEVDELYGMFVDDVAAGRNVPAATVRAGYGEGRVLPAAPARTADLIDRVATIDDVVRDLATGNRPTGRAAATSGGPGTVPPGDTREPNAPAGAEEVRARIAELRSMTPSV